MQMSPCFFFHEVQKTVDGKTLCQQQNTKECFQKSKDSTNKLNDNKNIHIGQKCLGYRDV